LSDQPSSEDQRQQAWARPVEALRVGTLANGAINLNVEGRRITGPVRGFGQMWQKTYRIAFTGRQVEPKEVIREWKANFPKFWPKNNTFYGPQGSITPGDVAVLNLAGPGGMMAPGGAPVISTGIMVIYADDESFSFMTPEGHMFAGMITFSAGLENGQTIAQIQALIRASDPFFEMMFRIGVGHRMEDDFWFKTLSNLALYFGAGGEPQLERVLVDPAVQWSEARNLRWNSGIRTAFYLASAPLRWAGSKMRGR
jgi:hypothetical protein